MLLCGGKRRKMSQSMIATSLLCVLISLIPMARTIASFGGAASALFGRQGAITQLMNKNASNE